MNFKRREQLESNNLKQKVLAAKNHGAKTNLKLVSQCTELASEKLLHILDGLGEST